MTFTVKRVLAISAKIVAVCLVFALCFAVGGTLSGLSKIAQQVPPSQTAQEAPTPQQAISPRPEAQPKPRPSQMSESFLPALLTFSVCVGVVLSYLILRSSWHGWLLAGAISVGIYGISTVAAQVESLFFLSNKMPPGMIRAIFLQGAIATALFAPVAVLLLGKWRTDPPPWASRPSARMSAPSIVWRLSLIVAAFVFLYMFFGYYVAWQNLAVRQYYGGPEYSSFYAALRANWMYHPTIYALQVIRALLYIACLFPLIRMLRAGRLETALAMALFLSAWTTVLLLPNPMMPSSVAHAHFWETLGFSLVFGALVGSLLSAPRPVFVKGAAV
jgi:hypothetical protein